MPLLKVSRLCILCHTDTKTALLFMDWYQFCHQHKCRERPDLLHANPDNRSVGMDHTCRNHLLQTPVPVPVPVRL